MYDFLPAVSMTLALAACSPNESLPSGTDAADTDLHVDPSDTADTDLFGETDLPEQPATELVGVLMPCQNDEGYLYADSYFIEVGENGATVTVDTRADSTAFDIALWDVDAGLLLADDDVECSFPPPDFSCPERDLEPGSYELGIANATSCANPLVGEYELRLTGDGVIVGPGTL